jgi:ubiquinone/menaquinone biosynthesis C-methylase UbiE
LDALLAQAARRAEAEGLPLATQVADAENLPFPDGRPGRR